MFRWVSWTVKKTVGRQREKERLKAGLEGALSGRGRLVMLVGEPGIGKAPIAQELASQAGEFPDIRVLILTG